MKKRDVVEYVAGEAGIGKQAADAAVGSVFASIAEVSARGEDIAVVGFGRFAKTERSAREGRNPRLRPAHRHRPLGRGVVQGRQGAEGRSELTAVGRRGADERCSGRGERYLLGGV